MRLSHSELLPASRLGVLVWLSVLCAVCYLNSLWGVFQFDDYKVIVDYEGMHSWQAWVDGLGHGIRPLLKLSYTLNWISGWGVAGFHLVNLSIHLANAWLVYRLAQEFVTARALGERLRHVPLLTAMLFTVHPIHTEAVTYISGRSSSLMALFYLGAVLAYAVGRKAQSPLRLHVATPMLFAAALAVKETAVTLPLALLFWELNRGGNWRHALRWQWPCWVLLLVAGAFFLLNDNYLEHIRTSAQWNTPVGNVATGLGGFAYLLRQWALPLWLNIDPDLPFKHNLSGVAGPALLVVAVVACTIGCARNRPWISFALAWVLLHLLALHLFLPRLDVANERQMLLAGWPLFLALCIELTLWLRPPMLLPLVASSLLVLAGLTVARNQIYASEVALWQDTVAKSPQKARAHNNLGYAYVLAGQPGLARGEFDVALQLDPNDIKAKSNLRRLDSP